MWLSQVRKLIYKNERRETDQNKTQEYIAIGRRANPKEEAIRNGQEARQRRSRSFFPVALGICRILFFLTKNWFSYYLADNLKEYTLIQRQILLYMNVMQYN